MAQKIAVVSIRKKLRVILMLIIDFYFRLQEQIRALALQL